MSETVETTTETTETPTSDKEINFERLRQEKAALEAEVQRLRPLEFKETVRAAGFDPDSGEGKSLIRDLAAGAVTAEEGQELAAVIAQYAEQEYGWRPTPALNPTEQQTVQAAQTTTQLDQVTVSDDPTDIEQQIRNLEAEGKHREARILKNRIVAAQMAAANRPGG